MGLIVVLLCNNVRLIHNPKFSENVLYLWVIDCVLWPAVPEVAVTECGFRPLPDIPIHLVVAPHGIMGINAHPVAQCWKKGQGPVIARLGRRDGRWGEQKIQQGFLFLVFYLPKPERKVFSGRVQVEVGLVLDIPRLRPVKEHDAAKDLGLGPVSHSVGEAIRIQAIGGVLRVREERRPGGEWNPDAMLLGMILALPRCGLIDRILWVGDMPVMK